MEDRLILDGMDDASSTLRPSGEGEEIEKRRGLEFERRRALKLKAMRVEVGDEG
jgi:hypothetical protein